MPPRTRNKEQAKKRRQDERGSSSGAAEGQSDLVIPGGRGLGHLNAIQLAQVEELQSKRVSGGYYFNYPLLDSYGCQEEAERLASQPYWEHLFSWRDDTYVPVVHEFIATFESTEESHQFTPSVKFTVFEQEYHLSVNQLGIHLGFYTQEYMCGDEYHNLPNDFDSDAALEDYWHRITGGTAGRFIGKKHNTTVIQSPALKALKLLLGLTFGGRHKNLHKVYRTDVFRLWSLEMNEPIQMACMVKQLMQTQAQEKCPYAWIGPILSRSYIPKIDDNPVQAEGQPQQPAPEEGGGQELHNHAMDTFNRRMDLQDDILARQEARQNQQYEAIEQLRLWMEHRFPPPHRMPPRTRNKEQAKKRRQDERGSSSGAAEGQSDLVIPGGRGLGHLNAIQLARVEELQSKRVSGGYYFNYPLLDSYGCQEEAERLASQPYWEHLFSWRDDTYVPVVHEFIATFESTEESHQFTPSVKFTVFEQEYHLSVNQLGIHLGFYTQEYMCGDEYHNLPNDFDSDAALEDYWHRITGGTAGRFIGKKHNTTVIQSPALKALKLLLGLTFGGRHKNLHKVYRTDVFRLWSLEMNEPIQMACMVKQLMQTQAQEKCPYAWIGPIVTRLCEGLGRGSATATCARGRGRTRGTPDYNMEYPEVHDWASMRAFQIQLHNHAMDTFNRRMDLQDDILARQEARQNQQYEAIEQLRLWMEHRFPPPS
nr:hypothetical protein GOBAR_AA21571 [Ipomoea batatas]